MYDLELTEAEMRWLQGHAAFADGIGSDIYQKVIAQVGPMPPLPRRVPMQLSEMLEALEKRHGLSEPRTDDAQAVAGHAVITRLVIS